MSFKTQTNKQKMVYCALNKDATLNIIIFVKKLIDQNIIENETKIRNMNSNTLWEFKEKLKKTNEIDMNTYFKWMWEILNSTLNGYHSVERINKKSVSLIQTNDFIVEEIKTKK